MVFSSVSTYENYPWVIKPCLHSQRFLQAEEESADEDALLDQIDSEEVSFCWFRFEVDGMCGPFCLTCAMLVGLQWAACTGFAGGQGPTSGGDLRYAPSPPFHSRSSAPQSWYVSAPCLTSMQTDVRDTQITECEVLCLTGF